MLKRSTALRFAAAATALTLFAPVWATEIQMKKKEDPKAQQQQSAAKAQGETKPSEPAKKKNCPEDGAFNTLEDLFGAAGPIDPLTGLPVVVPVAPAQATLAATAQAPATAVPAKAAPAIEWRAVEPPAEPAKPAPKEAEEKN